MNAYSIRDWDKLYETHDTKKLRRMNWVPVPTKHDGKGFRRAMALENVGDMFTAFMLMIQIAAKMPVRGVLQDGDGPLTPDDMFFKTGFPAAHFACALDVFSNAEVKIGWIVAPDSSKNPPVQRGIPGDTGRLAGIHNSTVHNITGNNIEGKGQEKDSNSAANSPPDISTLCDDTVKAWNETAIHIGIPKVTKLSKKRRAALQARVREPDWVADSDKALDKIPDSAFLRGENDRGWKASFDWFIRPDTVMRILEGAYDGKPSQAGPVPDNRKPASDPGKFDGVGKKVAV